MITLPETVACYQLSGLCDRFYSVYKEEIARLEGKHLPLQKALTYGSYALDIGHSAGVLSVDEIDGLLHIKTSLFYQGIIAGCACADDPSPNNQTTEYCEIIVTLNLQDATAAITLCD